jgi:RHH-type transcriptional regulator, rel operon repressor / antitoxin RelB
MTISLRLGERLSKKLAAAAKATGMSKSELIRACLDQYLLGAEPGPRAWDLGKDWFGCYDSGRGDLSARAKEMAGERIHARHTKNSRC